MAACNNFKKKAWSVYLNYIKQPLKKDHPENGWFEARKAIDLIIQSENPDLASVCKLTRIATKKDPDLWNEFHHVVFSEIANVGDKVKFIRPHAATRCAGGVIVEFSKPNVVIIKTNEKVAVKSKSTNLELI